MTEHSKAFCTYQPLYICKVFTIQQNENLRAFLNYNQELLFAEAEVYWKPGSDCGSIYEQLALRKYREILRTQIKYVYTNMYVKCNTISNTEMIFCLLCLHSISYNNKS